MEYRFARAKLDAPVFCSFKFLSGCWSGRKRYLIPSEICGVKLGGSNPESDVRVKFDHWKFYQNRFAQEMPLYFFFKFYSSAFRYCSSDSD